MSVHNTQRLIGRNGPDPSQALRRSLSDLKRWPLAARLALIGIILLYLPVIREVGSMWLHDDIYSHGLLVFPISLGLLWLERDRLRAVPYSPDIRGIAFLALGLVTEVVSWLLRIRFLMMASIIPVLAGCIIALHGWAMWRQTRFATLFLLFAAPIPGTLINYPDSIVQHISTVGATRIMDLLGYPITRQGNVINIPGIEMGVAEACSGFRKLFAMFAFATLYGYIYDLPLRKRLALILSVIPIALMANILRVAGLVAIASAWGRTALHIAHDPAEVFVVIVSCLLFIGLGQRIGCNQTRYAQAKQEPKPARAPSPLLTRRATLSALVASVLVLGTLGVNHAMNRIPFARPRLVPVDNFPRVIGSWTSRQEDDVPVDGEVQQKIPTARLIQRVYHDSQGHTVSLVLITATDYADFHSPNTCFPAQGWNLSNNRQIALGDQRANAITAEQRGEKFDVLYWLSGDYISSIDLGKPMKKLLTIRQLITGEQGGSLVVRVMAPEESGGESVAKEFALETLAPLERLNSGVPHL